MANPQKAYFFPPAWVYKPGGPIFLGSIISNPKVPQQSLNPDSNDAAKAFTMIVDDEQEDFHAIVDNSRQHGGGFDTSFLSMFTVGGSFDISCEKDLNYTLSIKSLRTQEISPDENFLNQGLSSAGVARFVAKKKHADLYCVIGLMTGTDVTISSGHRRNRSFTSQIGVNAGSVNVGPNVSTSADRNTEVSSHRKSDVVIAYRLKQICYLVKSKTFKTKDFTDRAVLAYDKTLPESEDEADEDIVVKMVELVEDEVGAEDFDLPAILALPEGDDTNVMEFVIPSET